MTELSHEEQQELNQLLHDATFHADGTPCRVGQYGPRAHVLLIDAVKAGRPWAEWVLESALHAGLQARVKRHVKATTRATLAVTDSFAVDRAAVFGVPRKEGSVQVALPGLTKDDLNYLIGATNSRIESERHNRLMFRRLLKILDKSGQPTVAGACLSLGLSLDEAIAA